MEKTYIGDGVYVETNGDLLVLTTSNGYGTTNTIVLEPEVLVSLQQFVAHWMTQDEPRRTASVGGGDE